MLLRNFEVVEFRGINEREFNGQKYYSINVEEDSGRARQYPLSNVDLVSGLKKGDKIDITFSESSYQGNTRLRVIDIIQC